MGFLVEIEAELQEIMIFEAIPGHTKILADSVFTRAFQDFMQNPPLWRIFPISSWRAEISLVGLAPTPPPSM